MHHAKQTANGKPKPDNGSPSKLSLYDELLDDTPIYNVCATLMFGCLVYSAARYLLLDEGYLAGFGMLVFGFGKLHVAAVAWTVVFLATCLVYFFFGLWAKLRSRIVDNKVIKRTLTDAIFLLLAILYIVTSLVLVFKVSMVFALPPFTSFVLSCEGVRFVMKAYAFMRTNVPRVNEKHKINTYFRNYIYFLFAPTLIYREVYSRTPLVRHRLLVKYITEFIAALLFFNFLWDGVIISLSKHECDRTFTIKHLILTCIGAFPIGLSILFMFNFCYLHALQNIFAELMRFESRSFYKDWWNSTGAKSFHRTWNVLVYDWTQNYVYKDIRKCLFGWRFGAKVVVMFLSAALHEFVIITIVKSFVPIFFLLFFITVFLLDIPEPPKQLIWNMVILYLWGLSCSVFAFLYTMEYYAVNADGEIATGINHLTPKCFSCM